MTGTISGEMFGIFYDFYNIPAHFGVFCSFSHRPSLVEFYDDVYISEPRLLFQFHKLLYVVCAMQYVPDLKQCQDPRL